MRERAADALGQHDRVHSRGREKTGLVRVQNTDRGINTLTGQPFRQTFGERQPRLAPKDDAVGRRG